MASVVTNEGTFRRTVISPLIAPTAETARSAITIASTSGRPSLCIQYITHGQNRKTWPADRSISASTSSSTSPIAIAATGPANPTAELRLSEPVKFDPALIAKYTNSAIVMTMGVSSRW